MIDLRLTDSDPQSADSPKATVTKGARAITIDYEQSNVNRFFHMINPDVITLDNNRYAFCSLKIPPAYANDMTVTVRDGGYKANVNFITPESYENELFLIGTTIDETERDNRKRNVLMKAVRETINSRKLHYNSRTTQKLVLDLPFQSEVQTSSDLFQDGECGQRCDISPIDPTNQNATLWVGNAVFVFKEIGNDFAENIGVDAASTLLVKKNISSPYNDTLRFKRARKRRSEAQV